MGTPASRSRSHERRVAELHAAALYAAADAQWMLDSLAALAEVVRSGATRAELAADLRVMADALDHLDS
jgi:truncated hemoglobin YjbI